MKVEVEDISSVKRKIYVQVPAEVVTEEFDKAYRELKRSAKLKGFRPGKAPRAILERYYGDRVRYEVTTKLIQETYEKSIKEKSMTPVSQPSIDDVEIRPEEDFHYTAIVEVKPDVEVADYIGLEVVEEKVAVTKKQVQERLEEIREMFATLEDVEGERPVEERDVVLVQHQILMNGEPLTDTLPQEQMIELKPERVEERLMKALIGLRPGEEANVPQTFSADHPDPRVAGKEGTLQVAVKRIQKKILPKLDDAFAKRLSENDTLEDLKAKIRKDLEEAEHQRIRSAMNETMITQLLEKHDMEVPEAMVEFQIQEMIQTTRRRLAAQGLTVEQVGQSEEQMRAQYREAAIRAVRTTLILEGIAKKEAIEVSDQDLEDSYQKIAERTGQPLAEIKKVYRENAALESLKGNLLEEKTLDFLRENAKIKGSKKSTKKRAAKSSGEGE